jgi:hypothetical protein
VFNAKFNNSKSKDRQCNVQKKKDKMTLTTQKTKYRARESYRRTTTLVKSMITLVSLRELHAVYTSTKY